MNLDNKEQPKIKPAGHGGYYRKPKMEIDWGFFHDIPIDEVAELLGIEANRNGNFLCPSHNDTKPSAQLRLKSNRWCCYTCGDGKPKSTIDLVMAVEGIGVLDAVKFLNQYYPGGISKPEKENVLVPPFVSKNMLKEIGLKSSPFSLQNVRGGINLDENEKIVNEQKQLQISYEEATNVMLDKLTEYITSWKDYVINIMDNFPELDNNARSYITEVANAKIENAQKLQELFRDFSSKLAEAADYQNAWDEIDVEDEYERAV